MSNISLDTDWGPDTNRITGLIYAWKGGIVPKTDHTGFHRVSGDSDVLPDNATRYIERTEYGVVTISSAATFDPTKIPMQKVMTWGGGVRLIEDYRVPMELEVTPPVDPTRGVRVPDAVAGTADAGDDLAAAIAEALANTTTREVILPAGVINIPGETGLAVARMLSGVTITGMGAGLTTIRGTELTAGQDFLGLNGTRDSRLRHVTLDLTAGTANTKGFTTIGAERCTIEDVRIRNSFGWGAFFSFDSRHCGALRAIVEGTQGVHGMEFNRSRNCFLRKSMVRAAVGHGLEAYHVAGWPNDDNEISDTIFHGPGESAVGDIGGTRTIIRRVYSMGAGRHGFHSQISEDLVTLSTEGTLEDVLIVGSGVLVESTFGVNLQGDEWQCRRVHIHGHRRNAALSIVNGRHDVSGLRIYDAASWGVIVNVLSANGSTIRDFLVQNPAVDTVNDHDGVQIERSGTVLKDGRIVDTRTTRRMRYGVNVVAGATGVQLRNIAGTSTALTLAVNDAGTGTVIRNVDGAADT